MANIIPDLLVDIKDDNQTFFNLLILIVETSSRIWTSPNQSIESSLTLEELLNATLLFVNSYLALDRMNRVVVIAAHNNNTYYLYPNGGMKSIDSASFSDCIDLKHVTQTLTESYRKLFQSTEHTFIEDDISGLPSAILKGLCYANKFSNLPPPGIKMQSRLVMLNSSPVDSTQYIHFMNASFAAQKQHIEIDACILIDESSLLQQVCNLTGGLYLRRADNIALLQFLIWFYLPSVKSREWFVQAPPTSVDTRASCCCHGKLIDMGFICSVCFSVYCIFTPVCSVCKATFKLPQLQNITKPRTL